MFCPQCGTKITEGALACPNCGVSLRGLTKAPGEVQQPWQPRPAEPPQRPPLREETPKAQQPSVPVSRQQNTRTDPEAQSSAGSVPTSRPGKNTAKSSERKAIVLPIVIVCAIAVAIVVALIASKGTGSVVIATNDSPVSGPAVHLEYLLDDLGSETSEWPMLTPGFDGTAALPEQPGEREGYAFIGWTSEYPQQKLETELLEPGTRVNIDDAPYAYYAVWRPLATFDGNGADSGETDPVAADTSGNITLPECGFSRKGYVFVGWLGSDPNELDHEATGDPAGTTRDLYSPQTFYACWRKSMVLPEISIDKAGTFDGELADWDSAMCAVAAIVKNKGTSTLKVSTSFSTYDASGDKVEDIWALASSVTIAPGDSRLVVGRADKRADSAKYSLEAQEPFPGTIAIQNVDVKVDKATEDGVEAQIVNNGKDEPQITSVCFVAKSKDGFVYVGGVYTDVELKARESSDLSITSENIYNQGPQPKWDEMEMTFYVDGSSRDEGYWQRLLEEDLARPSEVADTRG